MSLILFEVPSASNFVNKHAYLLAMNRIRQQIASLRLKKKNLLYFIFVYT